MELKYVGCTIWGNRHYEYTVDDNCIIYCNLFKNSKGAVTEFVVGLPGGTATMSHEESKDYRLGIEGQICAFTGNHPHIVIFQKVDANFASFYTADGKLIKKTVIHNNKFYMFDGTAYYEVTSDAKQIGEKSTETFVAKDESHMYAVSSELIAEKEKYEKIFSEIFETLRQPQPKK